jgi:hypothetical protein
MTDDRVRLDPLHLRSIDVRSAPGIPHGFRLGDFSPGINIITGPNSSGKSTTSRLLRQLFWSQVSDVDSDYRVTFRHDNADWVVRRAGNHVVHCERDGFGTLPPSFHDYGDELRERYHLPLHDLLVVNDEHFAALVAREAAGGYDLDEAIKRLGFTATPPQPQNLAKARSDAAAQLRLAHDAQRSLAVEEEKLSDLRRQANEALAASAHLQVLAKIEAAVAARTELSAATERFALFPPDLARFRGDEGEQIPELEAREATLREEYTAILRNRAEAERAVIATRLTPGGELNTDISTLENYRETLISIDRALESLALRRAEAEQRLNHARADVAAHLSNDRIVQQSLELLDQLAQAIAHRNRAMHELAAQEALSSWVGQTGEPEDLDRLREGIRMLRAWLVAPDPAAMQARRRDAMLLLAAAIAIAGSGVALGLWANPAGFAVILVAIAIAYFGASALKTGSTIDARSETAAKYERLRVGDPAEWTPSEVEALLGELEADLRFGLLEEQKRQRWGDLEPKRKASQQQAFELSTKTEELKAALGQSFELDEHSVGLISTRLKTWIDASDSLNALDAGIATQRSSAATALLEFNRLGSKYDLPESIDVATVRATIAVLKERANAATAAALRISQCDAQIHDSLEPQIERIAAQRNDIRTRIEVDDLGIILELWRLRSDWETAKHELGLANGTLNVQRAQLPGDFDLDSWDDARIAAERVEATGRSHQYQTRIEEIKSIEARVEQAKAGNTVDRALIALDRSTLELERHREESLARGIGEWIASSVRARSDETNLPQVVRLAQQIFGRITRGRFDLKFKPGNTAGFAAIETESGNELSLRQLSSATRVQLLLAVRIAFIETGERTAKLPIMLDETLANADESRATSLIESVIELSRHGRQIFYFTAQAEEVAKWQAIANRDGSVELRVFDLAKARGLASPEEDSLLRFPEIRRTAVPAPVGMSRSDYRMLLNVPAIDRWATSVGSVHLWYLEPGLDRLHALLERDFTTWGQLKSAIDRNGSAWLKLSINDRESYAARAGVISSAMAYSRIGHGRPMTRLDLEKSVFVGTASFDAIADLLEACEGDARTLCERLRNREIARVRGTMIDDLEAFAYEHNFVVDEMALDASEIRTRVGIDHFPAIEQEVLSQADIDRLFDDLAVKPAAEPLAMQAIGE